MHCNKYYYNFVTKLVFNSKMGAPKGHSKWGGKEKGTENKLTTTVKEVIFAAIDQQSVHFDVTMEQIRTDNPIEWAKIMVKLMDFVLPKKLDITTGGKVINVIPPDNKNTFVLPASDSHISQ